MKNFVFGLIKKSIKGGKQKTTGKEVVQPFKYKTGRSKLKRIIDMAPTKFKAQSNRMVSDIEKSLSDIEPVRTKLRQTTQKIAGEPITKSGISKGKNIKKKEKK